MKISMNAEFQILKNVGGAFVPMDENDIEYVGPGGFRFVIGGIEVPFDWEAAESGWGYDGVYEFSTGRGWFYNNFELDSCYDEAYEELGLKREDISAEFLASAQHINDFFVSFVTKDGKECEAGWWETNGKADAPYKLALRSVSFEDVENERLYSVKTAVVNSFNKGVRLVVKALSEDVYADVEMLDICSGNNVANMLDCEGYAWGLFEGDTLVGYCTIGGADELVLEEGFSYPGASVDSLLLSDVYIDPEYRGRGYAEFLVDEAVRQATEEANELVFLTVLDDGLARLYEKCGFEVINERAGLMVRDERIKTLESVLSDAVVEAEERTEKANRCSVIRVFFDGIHVDNIFARNDEVDRICDSVLSGPFAGMNEAKERWMEEVGGHQKPKITFEIDDDGPEHFGEVPAYEGVSNNDVRTEVFDYEK